MVLWFEEVQSIVVGGRLTGGGTPFAEEVIVHAGVGLFSGTAALGSPKLLQLTPYPLVCVYGGDKARDLSLTTLYLSFEMRFSHLGLGLLCVSCLLWESTCHCLPSTEIASVCHHIEHNR